MPIRMTYSTPLNGLAEYVMFDLYPVGICDPKPQERSGEEEFKEPHRQGLELWLRERGER